MKQNNHKNINLFTIIGIVVCMIIITVGATYAYFTANITGSETATSISVGAATITIVYATTDSITATNIAPGWSATRNFTLTGTNTQSSDTNKTVNYDINLVASANTFSTGALKYTLAGTNTGSNGTVATVATATNIPTGAVTTVLGSGTFVGAATSKVHTYLLTVTFPDTGSAQNGEQGKSFAGKITITSPNQYTN